MSKGRPEDGLNREAAAAVAWNIANVLEDLRGDCVADFVLLLRWMAYKADRDDAENIYVATEKAFAVNFNGVEEAAAAHMRKRAESYAREVKNGGNR